MVDRRAKNDVPRKPGIPDVPLQIECSCSSPSPDLCRRRVTSGEPICLCDCHIYRLPAWAAKARLDAQLSRESAAKAVKILDLNSRIRAFVSKKGRR